MKTDAKNIPLEELEVSVRTADVLQALPAKTLGQLLELPNITATRLSLAELRELFEELGVEYTGQMRMDEPVGELVTASGDIADRWHTISGWLAEHSPDALKGFSPPATAEQIAAAEEALGVSLPSDYRDFLLLHDGQAMDGPMVWTCSLLPVAALAERRQRLVELYGDPQQPDQCDSDPAIRPVAYTDGWIPIGISARGRDFLCLDLDPSESGRAGQVILIAIDFSDHKLIASSFGDFLGVYFDQVQRGEIEIG